MTLLRCTIVLLIGSMVVPAIARQNKPPLEYIESSSPLPGGGVVSSVYVPGTTGPVYNSNQGTIPTREVSLRQQAQTRSVLDSGLQGSTHVQPTSPQIVYQQPVYQNPGYGYQPGYTYPSGTAPQSVVARIPSLGVPTTWNRSMRPNCAGCGVGSQVPGYGTVAPPPATLPSAASLQPSLQSPATGSFSQPGTLALPPHRPAYTPVLQLRNLPPNVYAGQGIIGSPKLYVDGQPMRNLIRYLIVP